MADIKLRIEVNPNAETEKLGTIVNKVNSTGSNLNVVNTSFKANSSGEFVNLPEERVSGSNGLSMASEDNSDAYDFIFNDDDELDNVDGNGAIVEDEEDPSEFIWGIVPNDKKYSVKLTFTGATALKDIIVYGDTVVGQFPTKAIIDETTTIYSDDAKWAINMQTEAEEHTIEFVEWNRANYNACISNIRVTMQYFDLDKGWIDSVESLAQATSDPSSIQYGMLANSGSVKLRDLDGELKDLIVDGVIPKSNVPIELIVNGNKTQSHVTESVDYDTVDKILSFSLTNSIANFDRQYEGLTYSTFISKTRTLKDYLYQVLISFGYDSEEIYYMLNTDMYLGGYTVRTVSDYLEKIKVSYGFLNRQTYREAINAICEVAQLWCFEDNNGKLKFINARPQVYYHPRQVVKISQHQLISQPSYNLIVNNELNNVQYQEKSNKYSISPTIAKTYYLRNSDNEFDVTQINDTAQLLTIGSSTYICFFVTQNSTSNQICRYGTFSYESSGIYPFQTLFEDKTGTEGGKIVGIVTNTTDTMETFDFSTMSGECTLLEKLSNPFDSYTFAIKIRKPTSIENPSKLSIWIYSQCVDVSIGNQKSLTSSSKVYDEPENELMATTTTIDGISIFDYMAENIISDYKNGIKTMDIEMFCSNMYYDYDNSLAKNWSNGEILERGDIVVIKDSNDKNMFNNADGSEITWEVVSVQFNYSGMPKLTVKLMEII